MPSFAFLNELFLLELAEVCGREISLMCIWQGHDWAWGNVRVEALISSRTIYGTRSDVEHLHSDAMTFLYDGLKMLDLVAEALGKIRNLVATVQIYEVCKLRILILLLCQNRPHIRNSSTPLNGLRARSAFKSSERSLTRWIFNHTITPSARCLTHVPYGVLLVSAFSSMAWNQMSLQGRWRFGKHYGINSNPPQ